MKPWMKPWMKRTRIGLLGALALFGGLAAWAHSHHESHGWRGMGSLTDEEAQNRENKFVARAATLLKLDDTQKARLSTLALALREQRKALVAPGSDPRAELQSLVSGATFDRARASAMVEAKLGAVNLRSPAVITAAADFYDSLKPEQQAQVRDFMAKRQRFGRGGERERHGERGEGSERGRDGGNGEIGEREHRG